MFTVLLPGRLREELRAVEGKIGTRTKLAVAYAYAICRSEPGCEPREAVWSAVGLGMGRVPRETPPGLTSKVLSVLEEADEAAVQPPKTVLARVVLDADALSRSTILSLLAAQPPRSLEEFLAGIGEALSYAVSLDYILYTRTARAIASRVKPHTIALARWLAEELAQLGLKLAYRAEAVYEGHIAILDLQECPDTGGKPVREAVLKPLRNCVEYRLTYTCPTMKLEVPICIPETTRAT